MEKYKIISYKKEEGKFDHYIFNLHCNIHNYDYIVEGTYKRCEDILQTSNCGCPYCGGGNHLRSQELKKQKIELIKEYDVLNLTSEELMFYILNGELPEDFMIFTYSLPNSLTRKESINGYEEKMNIEHKDDEDINDEDINIEKPKHIDNILPTENNTNNEVESEIEHNKSKKSFEDILTLFNENQIYQSIIISYINRLFIKICRLEESKELNELNKTLKEYKEHLNNPHTDFEKFIYTYFFNEYNAIIDIRKEIENF